MMRDEKDMSIRNNFRPIMRINERKVFRNLGKRDSIDDMGAPHYFGLVAIKLPDNLTELTSTREETPKLARKRKRDNIPDILKQNPRNIIEF